MKKILNIKDEIQTDRNARKSNFDSSFEYKEFITLYHEHNTSAENSKTFPFSQQWQWTKNGTQIEWWRVDEHFFPF